MWYEQREGTERRETCHTNVRGGFDARIIEDTRTTLACDTALATTRDRNSNRVWIWTRMMKNEDFLEDAVSFHSSNWSHSYPSFRWIFCRVGTVRVKWRVNVNEMIQEREGGQYLSPMKRLVWFPWQYSLQSRPRCKRDHLKPLMTLQDNNYDLIRISIRVETLWEMTRHNESSDAKYIWQRGGRALWLFGAFPWQRRELRSESHWVPQSPSTSRFPWHIDFHQIRSLWIHS